VLSRTHVVTRASNVHCDEKQPPNPDKQTNNRHVGTQKVMTRHGHGAAHACEPAAWPVVKVFEQGACTRPCNIGIYHGIVYGAKHCTASRSAAFRACTLLRVASAQVFSCGALYDAAEPDQVHPSEHNDEPRGCSMACSDSCKQANTWPRAKCNDSKLHSVMQTTPGEGSTALPGS
jgi:hypothetical protein